jgi:ADP-ribosylglycohydrolase
LNSLQKKTNFTDDSVLTVAIADSLVNKKYFNATIHRYSRLYPNVGFGSQFKKWSKSKHPKPYGSYGNGSAMRVSPVAYAFDTLEEVLQTAKKTSEFTHNHPEAVKGAQAIASSVFLAYHGKDKLEIKKFIENTFGYDLNFKLDSIRKEYVFDVSAKGSVPQAIVSFLESSDFEDSIRNAISIGGDSDTIASMSGAIAEAYYKKIPSSILDSVVKIIPKEFQTIVKNFYSKFGLIHSILIENIF